MEELTWVAARVSDKINIRIAFSVNPILDRNI